ncbi:hypothetical protein B0I37DRAFT_352811 [Chaetomium sp. MPI-CAGE-AT-0009]|nr:hypothetical protein B0I37DRAFT_352811 [Chaetomium sp. MPI-CAGE-AT-0009]
MAAPSLVDRRVPALAQARAWGLALAQPDLSGILPVPGSHLEYELPKEILVWDDDRSSQCGHAEARADNIEAVCILLSQPLGMPRGLNECYPPKEADNERGSSAEQGRRVFSALLSSTEATPSFISLPDLPLSQAFPPFLPEP